MMRTAHSPGLLVGEERDHEVALGLMALAQDVLQRGDDHGIHVLHVHRASAPEHAVFDDAAERIDAPVVGVGGHDVGVAVHHQRRQARIGTLHAGYDARAAGIGVDVGGRQSELFEQRTEIFGRLGF